MDEAETSLWRDGRLYVLLVPALLFSLGLSQLIGHFDGLWLSRLRYVGLPLPFDLQIVFGLGQMAKWTPAAIVFYWMFASVPWGRGRWLSIGDVFFGVAAMAFFQLLVFMVYMGSSFAATLWR